jgi:hypothetical protein
MQETNDIKPVASFEGHMHPHNYAQEKWEERRDGHVAFFAGLETIVSRRDYVENPCFAIYSANLCVEYPDTFPDLASAQAMAKHFTSKVLNAKLMAMSSQARWKKEGYNEVALFGGLEMNIAEVDDDGRYHLFYLNMSPSVTFGSLASAKAVAREFAIAVLKYKLKMLGGIEQ